jgi:hypothetical protein
MDDPNAWIAFFLDIRAECGLSNYCLISYNSYQNKEGGVSRVV